VNELVAIRNKNENVDLMEGWPSGIPANVIDLREDEALVMAWADTRVSIEVRIPIHYAAESAAKQSMLRKSAATRWG
jgi:hypothetical protein